MLKRSGLAFLASVVALSLFPNCALAQLSPLPSPVLEELLKSCGVKEEIRTRILESHAEYAAAFHAALAADGKAWQPFGVLSLSKDRNAVREWCTKTRKMSDAVEAAGRPIVIAIRAAEGEIGEAVARRLERRWGILRDLDLAVAALPSTEQIPMQLAAMPAEWVRGVGIDPTTLAELDAVEDALLAERIGLARKLRDAAIAVPSRHFETLGLGASAASVHELTFKEWTEARVAWLKTDGVALEWLIARLGSRDGLALLAASIRTRGSQWSCADRALQTAMTRAASLGPWIAPAELESVDRATREFVAKMMGLVQDLSVASFQTKHSDASSEDKPKQPPECDRTDEVLKAFVTALGNINTGGALSRRNMLVGPNAPEGMVANPFARTFMKRAAASSRIVDAKQPRASSHSDDQRTKGPESAIQRPMDPNDLEAVFVVDGVEVGKGSVFHAVFGDYLREASEILGRSKELPPLVRPDLPPDDSLAQMVTSESDLTLPDSILAPRREERARLRRELLDLDLRTLSNLDAVVTSDAGTRALQWLRAWRKSEHARAGLGNGISAPPSLWSGDFDSLLRRVDLMAVLVAANPSHDEWNAISLELEAVYLRLVAKATAIAAAHRVQGERHAEVARITAPKEDGDDADFVRDGAKARAAATAASEDLQAAARAYRDEVATSVAKWQSIVSPELATRLQDAWDSHRFGPELWDGTDLETRIEIVLGLDLPTEVRERVAVKCEEWRVRRAECRVKLIRALAERESSGKGARVDRALWEERDEMNRRIFRSIMAELPEEFAERVPPLPKPRKG